MKANRFEPSFRERLEQAMKAKEAVLCPQEGHATVSVRMIASTLAKLATRWIETRPEHGPYGAWEFFERNSGMPLQQLGNGHFSMVLQHPEHPRVVFKVCLRRGDSSAAYIAYCRQNPGPHLPEVVHVQHHNEGFVAVLPLYEAQKQYNQYIGNTWDRARRLDWAYKDGVSYFAAAQHCRVPLSFAKAAYGVFEYFKGLARFDLHYENVMQDSHGTLIITDPISFSKSSEDY